MSDIVYRIKTIVKLLFGSSTHYKMFVTSDEKIFKDAYLPRSKSASQFQIPVAELAVQCPKCGKSYPLYAKFGPVPPTMESKIKQKAKKFPENNKLDCDCGFQFDLTGLRNQLEKEIGQKIMD